MTIFDTLDRVAVDVTNPESPFGGVQIVGIAEEPVLVTLREGVQGPPGEPGIPGPPGPTGSSGADGSGSGISASGIAPLVVGQIYVDVVFPTVQSNADWNFVECIVVNTVTSDSLRQNLWPTVVTSKTASGFRVQLNGTPDNANYYLHWAISGANIPPVVATTYSLSGPSAGPTGAPSGVFTVALLPSTTVPAPVTVTPDDGGAGGTFTPTSVMLTTEAPSGVFTYTPAADGAVTIGTANDGGLIDPVSIAFTAATFSTTYALSGPSTGDVGVASTNFTVALPVGGSVPSPVTVTPGDGGGGGTFAPTSVILSTAAPSATFTYTPASTGTKTISTTNDGGLTDPADLSYIVTSGVISDGDTVLVWPDSSPANNDGLHAGNPIFKEGIAGGKPVVRFAGVGDGFNLTTPISANYQWHCFVVMKADVTKTLHSLQSSSVLGPTHLPSSGVDYLFHNDRDNYWLIANASQRGAFHVFEFGAYAAGTISASLDGTSLSLTAGANPAAGDFNYLGGGDGDIAEIVFCSTGLVGANRVNAIATLGAKYGITVAGGGSIIDLATLPSLVGWWKADAIT